jgi:hypothetical protein
MYVFFYQIEVFVSFRYQNVIVPPVSSTVLCYMGGPFQFN